MSTDRKLLEMAAKAAGINVWHGRGFQADMLFRSPKNADPEGRLTGVEWNPIKDDSDAVRLAMTLCAAGKMRVQITEQNITCFYEQEGAFVPWGWEYETCTISEAFRKCITGAAAEIGRNMP